MHEADGYDARAHSHTHSHGCGDCGANRRGALMHAEGASAEHLLHAVQVRDAWLAAAMKEAEDEDRASGVWELASDKWEAGDIVAIEGLRMRPDLNDATAILLSWHKASARWGVSVVATDERVKVKPPNLRRVASRSITGDTGVVHSAAVNGPAEAVAAEVAAAAGGEVGAIGGVGGAPPRLLVRGKGEGAGRALAEAVGAQLACKGHAAHTVHALSHRHAFSALISPGRCMVQVGIMR